MVAGLRLSPLRSLPGDLDELIEISLEEGHGLLQRLRQEWGDGSNRFDQPGELLLEARLGPRLVGIGGLNRDPYLSNPEVGRIRHVYVHSAVQRSGVGRALVSALLEHAGGRFEVVRLRTFTEEASRFYEALGFTAAPDEPDATHRVVLDSER